ncbi:hypothetical protein ACFLZ8_04500 [Planctomycetota bacterium]
MTPKFQRDNILLKRIQTKTNNNPSSSGMASYALNVLRSTWNYSTQDDNLTVARAMQDSIYKLQLACRDI